MLFMPQLWLSVPPPSPRQKRSIRKHRKVLKQGEGPQLPLGLAGHWGDPKYLGQGEPRVWPGCLGGIGHGCPQKCSMGGQFFLQFSSFQFSNLTNSVLQSSIKSAALWVFIYIYTRICSANIYIYYMTYWKLFIYVYNINITHNILPHTYGKKYESMINVDRSYAPSWYRDNTRTHLYPRH